MNTDLIIHILLAVDIVMVGVIAVVLRFIASDMDKLVRRMSNKVDNMSQNEKALMDMVKDLDQQKSNEKQMKEAIMERLVAQMREKFGIKVVDGEKPLDFPNDH